MPIRPRQSRRSLSAVATIAAAGLALAGCGSGSSSNTASSGSGSVKVAAVIKGLDNPFFQTMEAGIQNEPKTADASTTVQAAQSITDTSGQADKLSAMAGQDYGCFVLNPISGTNLVQGMAQLVQKDVTSVTVQRI